ncbi:MAG: AEC family transporter [Rhodospirillales bacterium]|nr:AEC family transporter [Rhodospirillales bacterium]MSP79452.1 AEC family transporter [Rhodospirillales bacterium]
MFETLVTIIAPVLICAAIGYAWAKSGRRYDVEIVTVLATSISLPALVFTTLVETQIEIAALGKMVAAAVAATGLFGAVGAAVLKLARIPLRSFLPAMMFPNVGNMGLPLAALGFGEAGLALAIVFFAVSVVLQITIGVALAAGTVSPRALVRIPALYAVAGAIVILAGGLEAPAWLLNTTRILGGMLVPLMLITLGVSLAGLKVGNLGRGLGLALLRFALGIGAGLGVGYALGLEDTARAILILQAAMPVAVINFLFAQRYGTDPAEVAGLVVISTLFGFATLPFLIGALL